MRLLLPAILLLTWAAMPAFAQPTVTSTALPIASFTANVQYGTTSTMLSPGLAGANASWNFASFSGGTASTSSYAACPGAPGCSTFPGSTLVGTDNNGSASYFSVLNGVQSNTGYQAGSSNVIYSDPEDFVRTPMTFNSTFTDPFFASIPSGVTMYRIGSSTVTADGYGTLTTPAGTYSNVLRVKRTMTSRDSMPGLGVMFTYTGTTYLWYSPSVRDYLFVISSLTLTPNGGTGSTTNTAGYRTGVTSSVAEGAAQTFFRLSPNPARSHLSLRWDATMQATASLTDLTGRALMQQTDRGAVSFAVEALPRGLYLLRVQDESGMMHSEKVMLQ